jgi:hypothetical protein
MKNERSATSCWREGRESSNEATEGIRIFFLRAIFVVRDHFGGKINRPISETQCTINPNITPTAHGWEER